MKLLSVFALMSVACAVPLSGALAQNAAAPAKIELPAACQTMAQGNGNMAGNANAGTPNTASGMGDANKALMQAMNDMNPPMMQAMMIKDADVAFTCSMIAHHQGAIAMAKAEVQYGKNPAMKKMAQNIIAKQTREIDAMTKWVNKHAK